MDRLGRAVNVNFAGKWFAKMEFQKGGWVHWHLIILGVRRVEHALLERTWSHGWVWIDRMDEKSLRYLCKYISKDSDGLPPWVFLEPVRTVKMTRASSGFWGEGQASRSDDDDDNPPPGAGTTVSGFQGPAVGHFVAKQAGQVTVRSGLGRWRSFTGDLVRVLMYFRDRGVQAQASPHRAGWLRLEGIEMGDVERAFQEQGQGRLRLGGSAAGEAGLPLLSGGLPPHALREAIQPGGWMWWTFFELAKMREE
jgi:hypothetical protein